MTHVRGWVAALVLAASACTAGTPVSQTPRISEGPLASKDTSRLLTEATAASSTR